MFTEKKGLFKSPNLTGHFVEYPDSFFITPKWSFAHIRNYETDPAYLKGIIFDTVNNRTKIEITVRPNSVFLIVLVGFLIAAIGRLYKFLVDKELLVKLLPALFGGIFILGLLSVTAKYFTKSIRSSFERYLEIFPFEDKTATNSGSYVKR